MLRRQVLKGLGAGLALPFIAERGLAADTEILIIGAGAAGLAAARVCMDAGIGFQVIEAKDRIGGRALTDTRTFGKPFDLGCAFQHQAKINPWVRYARDKGFAIGPIPDDEQSQVRIGGREVSDRDYAAIEARERRLEAALSKAGKAERDISFHEAARHVGRSKWDAMIYEWIFAGPDPAETSVMDWWNGKDGADYFCPAGFGTLVSHFGRDIPVRLGVSAQSIDWSKPGVSVTTNKGTIRARHCLVTVSNGVLINGGIRFTPALHDRDALLAGIPMAAYMTIGFKFKRRQVLPTPPNVECVIWNKDGRDLTCIGDIGGSGITRVNVHGNLARELETEGGPGAIEFAVTELRRAFGKNRISEPLLATASAWGRDPHVRGAWAAARPGYHNSRPDLANSIAERLHFAGEACHEDLFTTCGGAFLSGQEAAARIVELVQKG